VSGNGPVRNCAEDDAGGAGCTQLAARGEDRCPEHLGWPWCAACGKRRIRPGGVVVCDRCADQLGAVADAELAGLLAEAARRVEEQENDEAWGRVRREDIDPQPQQAPF
jgi:hypothetical protein